MARVQGSFDRQGLMRLGDRLEAIGTVLKVGRTLSVCRLEVYAVGEHDERKLVAAGQQTLISVPGEAGS